MKTANDTKRRMKFGTVDIHQSEGCILAHSLHIDGVRIGKGTFITADIASTLADSGLQDVLVARLEAADMHEDIAALTVATALGGNGVSLSSARTGRVNLLARVDGLCHFDAQTIIKANAVDEVITVATLPENSWVAQGRMVATIKIIPYAVPHANVQQVLCELTNHTLSVTPAAPHSAELIQTRLSNTKESVLNKTLTVTKNRLATRAVSITMESRCSHDTKELSTKITASLQRHPDWILIVGASAISDREDVIPQAIVAAGGTVDRYGIPVDPGNLLLLAHIGNTRIIGLPGCARSSRYNGLDMIIDRMACNVTVTNQWLNTLSVGGLLEEIADRPAPRIQATEPQRIGAVILAAGSSRRAGNTNKLLAPYRGLTLISHIAQVVSDSQVSQVIAVTGYEAPLVSKALASMAVQCHHNTAHTSGMGSSVVAGVSQLTEKDGILICLGDMPHVSTDIINTLIDAFRNNPHKSIFVPVNGKKRGNPVLFGKIFFDTLLTLDGDVGARTLLQQYPDEVLAIEIDDNGILVDYDTEAELNTLVS